MWQCLGLAPSGTQVRRQTVPEIKAKPLHTNYVPQHLCCLPVSIAVFRKKLSERVIREELKVRGLKEN